MSLIGRFNYARYRLLERTRGHEYASRKAGVQIGQGCRIYSKVATSEPWLVRIGDRVTVSTDVTFVTHDGSGWLLNDARGRRYRYAHIQIGNDVFVGARSLILPGVEIGDRVIVGAGSVVTKSVPSGSVIAGSPARIIGDWDEYISRMSNWKTAADMRGGNYRERVNSIVERVWRPQLSRPNRV